MRVLRHRGFAVLWGSQLVSGIGDMVLYIALPFYVYAKTGSALASGGIFVAQTIPRFMGPFAGVLIDRWDRRRTMVRVDLFRTIALLPLLVLGSGTIWVVYVVGVVQALAGQLFYPASNALVPNLVPEEELTAANSLMQASNALTTLVGPPLGGALLAFAGLTTLVVADSASFLISAASLAVITVPVIAAAAGTQAARNFWTELREGLQLVGRSRLLVGLVSVLFVLVAGDGAINVILVPFVRTRLGAGPTQFGLLVSAFAIGTIMGTVALSAVHSRFKPGALMAGALLGGSALFIVLASTRSFAVAAIVIFGIGPASAVVNVIVSTLVQKSVADRERGRLFGIMESIGALGTMVGMATAAALTDSLGVAAMFVIAAGCFAAGALLTVLLVRVPEPVELRAELPVTS